MRERDELFPLTEAEGVKLLKWAAVSGEFVDFAFGTGGIALIWRESCPMPEAVKQLGLMRGVFNENTEGSGI